jgi:hypothetical protein
LRKILLTLVLLSVQHLYAQTKTLEAVKITTPIKLDGNADEAAWQTVTAAGDFVQNFPTFGKPASQRTTVKIAYDNTAVYIVAYMYDNKKNIRKQLTQRDALDRQDVDIFSIGLDTYNDKQNAYLFQITAAGVQADARFSQTITGENGGLDKTWDAVWESKVSIKADGWVAEIKIPFSAIRFSKKEVQDWGLQFQRLCRSTNEGTTWSPTNPAVSGNINQWGVWKDLKNIAPPLRLSFLPYLSGGVKTTPTGNGHITEYLKSGGMDIKYGINESFTLDVTLIPDFAQVQSDNVFLNLTPFQVRFDDFRPFFTEGTELFNKAGLFYSRRIGNKPSGADAVLNTYGTDSNYLIKKNPGISLLYNASKFSGRTKNNLGIGILNAITRPMYAEVLDKSTGKDSSFLTEQAANYNIIVLDQALKNRSSISFTNTNVLRNGNTRNANVSALDISLFDRRNNYNLRIAPRFSSIWGKNGSYNGFANYASFAKVSGAMQYVFSSQIESDQYDPNDMGFLHNNNSVRYEAGASYNYFTPTRHFLNHSYNITIQNRYLYKPFTWTELKIAANSKFIFRNFWDISFSLETKPMWTNDYFEARKTGVLFKSVPYVFGSIGGSSDSRKKLFGRMLAGYAIVPNNAAIDYFYADMGLRYRFGPRLLVNASSIIERENNNRGYGFVPSTNNDIIFTTRDLTRVTSILSAQYGFTARMNFTIRMRHYWSYLQNSKFHTLKPDGFFNDIPFIDGYNQNFNSFNIDMFYTWDFLWGSRLTFAWKNAIGGIVNLDPYQYNSFRKNLGEMFVRPHSNEVSLKIVYYLDYLKLKKGK